MFQSYDPETGKIIYTIRMEPDGVEEITKKFGEHLAERNGNGVTHYVDVRASPPVLREKQPQQTRLDKGELKANGEDFITLSDLPIPCKVRIGEDLYQVNDGILEWGTLRRGDYHITVEAVPFLVWDAEVCAV